MIRKCLPIAALALAVASSAIAATQKSTTTLTSTKGVEATYIGPRVGFSIDPDQVVLGGHLSTGFAPSWTFNPSIEVGFGDDQTVTALNFDGEYHFRVVGSAWSPYIGLGMGVNFISVNAPSPYSDYSDTVTGLNIIFGTSVPTSSGQRLFTELRVGAGDSAMPELKGMFGWNFRM